MANYFLGRVCRAVAVAIGLAPLSPLSPWPMFDGSKNVRFLLLLLLKNIRKIELHFNLNGME